LRVFFGPEEDAPLALAPAQERTDRVTVPVSEVFPALAQALASHRSWVHDFADDEVTISTDLYEIILAFQHYRDRA
jgi:hypothetical protein